MTPKPEIQLITAAVLALAGLILLFCGLYIDPRGEIHETVLVAYGEILTFAGSLMGIDYHYRNRNNSDNNGKDYTKIDSSQA